MPRLLRGTARPLRVPPAPHHRVGRGVAWQVRDFIAAQGERRFFLHLLTVSSHQPYGDASRVGKTPVERCPSLSAREAAPATMARKPVGTDGQARMLREYLRELRCVDEYIKEATASILLPLPALHPTTHPRLE